MTPPSECELDLTILDMSTADVWKTVGRLLAGLPGINRVRLLERGALLHYDPRSITKDQICASLRGAGSIPMANHGA
jgi:hypothetical protein